MYKSREKVSQVQINFKVALTHSLEFRWDEKFNFSFSRLTLLLCTKALGEYLRFKFNFRMTLTGLVPWNFLKFLRWKVLAFFIINPPTTQGGSSHIAIWIYVIVITRSEKCFRWSWMVLRGAHSDATSFLVDGRAIKNIWCPLHVHLQEN